jgi:hypothetical protein
VISFTVTPPFCLRLDLIGGVWISAWLILRTPRIAKRIDISGAGFVFLSFAAMYL